MKFHLPQSFYNPELKTLLRREIKREHDVLSPLTKNELQETAAMFEAIKGNSGLPNYLMRSNLNAQLGDGIFLHPKADPLTKGHVIAPYAGEISLVPMNAPDESAYAFSIIEDIVLNKKEQQKWDPSNHYHPKRLYSFKLDAWKIGNFTRFINHSEKPNLIAYTVCIRKNRIGIAPSLIEVVYFVKKKIRPGEQLLVSYESGAKNYWGGHKNKAFPMTPQTFRLEADLQIKCTS